MARAKRTERSEARRRYRAYLQEQAEREEAVSEEESEAAATAKPSRQAQKSPATAPTPAPGQRVGFMQAMRVATRPVHYVDDLRFTPQLVLHSNAVWVPALISIAFAAYGLTRNDYNDPGIGFMLSIAYPPIIQAVVSGFLAPRASWLAGLIAGAIGGIGASLVYTYLLSGRLANTPSDKVLQAGNIPLDVLQLVLNSVIISIALAAGSAWYKRFLAATMPNRAAQSRSSHKAQPRRTAATSRTSRR